MNHLKDETVQKIEAAMRAMVATAAPGTIRELEAAMRAANSASPGASAQFGGKVSAAMFEKFTNQIGARLGGPRPTPGSPATANGPGQVHIGWTAKAISAGVYKH